MVFLEDFEIYYAFLQGNLRDGGECNITVTLDLKKENDDFGCILKDLMKKHRLLKELV